MMLVLGVGNEMRGDDAFGPLVVKKLEGKTSAVMWSGETPENFVTKVRGPVEMLIVLDTAQLGKRPGTVELLEPDKIRGHASTHKLPLSLLIGHMKPEKTFFIAAQPKSTNFGNKPSPEILKAVGRAVGMILELSV